ncbi:hypothetical protein [Nocardioides sp.]|uniref:hypothetical protein n=1 Tax=Nocardioides sp. TaxID=35761 RepID=UPI002ED3B0B9
MRTETANADPRLTYRLACVVPATVGVAVALWAASRDNGDYCGTVGECLGLSLNDLVALAFAVPFAALLLRLLEVPRVMLHTAASLVLGGTLWFTADELLRVLAPGRSYDAVLPLPVALAVGVLTGAASTYLVGPGGHRWVRLAIPAGGLIVAVATSLASAHAAHAHRVDEIAAVPVTLYTPVVEGHRPSYSSGADDSVRLSYSFDGHAGHVFLSVTLIPTPGGSLCDAEGIIVGPECVQEGDVMRDLDPSGYGSVGLVRGDTALVADFTTDDLDPDDVLDALRDAPVGAPADLV